MSQASDMGSETDYIRDLRHQSREPQGEVFASIDPVRQYLNEIGKYPLLSAEEEKDLGKKIQEGQQANEKLEEIMSEGYDLNQDEIEKLQLQSTEGSDALDLMVNSNLRLVVSIARRYVAEDKSKYNLLDLIQEGNTGLIRAAEKFDYTKGFKFSTYATWWIRQAITRSIANDGSTIRVPVHRIEQINRLRNAENKLIRSEVGITDEGLMAELGCSKKELEDIRGDRLRTSTFSLDDQLTDDGGDFYDILSDDNPTVENQALNPLTKELLHDLIDKSGLTDREKEVVKDRFGLSDGEFKTLGEVGKKRGVTRERIRQIEFRALAKMRRKLLNNPSLIHGFDFEPSDEKIEELRRKSRQARRSRKNDQNIEPADPQPESPAETINSELSINDETYETKLKTEKDVTIDVIEVYHSPENAPMVANLLRTAKVIFYESVGGTEIQRNYQRDLLNAIINGDYEDDAEAQSVLGIDNSFIVGVASNLVGSGALMLPVDIGEDGDKKTWQALQNAQRARMRYEQELFDVKSTRVSQMLMRYISYRAIEHRQREELMRKQIEAGISRLVRKGLLESSRVSVLIGAAHSPLSVALEADGFTVDRRIISPEGLLLGSDEEFPHELINKLIIQKNKTDEKPKKEELEQLITENRLAIIALAEQLKTSKKN